MNKKSIAIDMDGVLADTPAQLRHYYAQETGIHLPADAFDGIPEDNCLPEGAVRRYVFMPGFFRTTPPIAGAAEAVRQLMDEFDVYIVSAAIEFPQSLPEKLEWLHEHLPFVSWHRIVFCGNKNIINTHYMIDDHVKNLDHFAGKTFLFTAPHNLGIRHHQRVNNWAEAMAALRAEQDRPVYSSSL